jgi:pyruvate dehydrogenase E2 component (dihydrolipoyllysine-residue acetyltransferase)
LLEFLPAGEQVVATEVKLPRLGQGMESGTIVRWLKAEGDRVEKGEPLYELDTEKVTQEVEAEASGVLLKIAVAEGEVEVGRTVAIIGEEGEDVPDVGGDAPDAPVAEAAKVQDDVQEEGSPGPARQAERERGRRASGEFAERIRDAHTGGGNGASAPDTGGRIKASPLARRIARERGIDLASVSGTGPDGRIVAEDVERAAKAPPPAPTPAPAPDGEIEERPLTNIRKTIARRLTEAWEAPAFQLRVSVDMTQSSVLRERLVAAAGEDEPRITVSDVLTKLSAVALLRHRDVNAHFVGDAVRLFPTANIGLAVAAPQGLVVPVIRSAERLALAEIAAARADIVSRARANKLRQEDLQDGTFTISNLGMYGVEEFIAVLNPPQAAILAVGAIELRPVVIDEEFDMRQMMSVTLTCDHRAVDGAAGADFLRTLKSFLELPGLAL